MPNASKTIKLEHIIDIALKRRWFILIPFCLSMIGGLYLAFTLPKIYRSETLILIEPQRVPTSYVQSVVSSDLDARISTISQQIMSRTNLDKVISDFSLYAGPEYKDMYMEDKIASMRDRISVDVTRTKKGTDAFSISFKGTNPKIVMRVANALATYFIDQNLKVREAQAIGTNDFLEDELLSMRKRLEDVEEVLKKYRIQYMGALPEQLETNLRVLDRLQEDLSEKQASLRDVKNRLALLDRLPSSQGPLAPAVTEENVSNPDQLRQLLISFEARYTDQHPDVVRLKKMIADLEEKEDKEGEKTDGESGPEPASRTTHTIRMDEMRNQIKALEVAIAKTKKLLTSYQKRVEDTPKREQELMALRRDHHNIQESYNSLLNRKLESEISVNMEKKQKGERFRILDPARLPQRPISPNMKKIFALAVSAGLGTGAAIIWLLESFNSAFKNREDIESFLGLPVLASVPPLYKPKDIRLQKINQILSIFFTIICLVILTGFCLLTAKGVDQTVELVRRLL